MSATSHIAGSRLRAPRPLLAVGVLMLCAAAGCSSGKSGQDSPDSRTTPPPSTVSTTGSAPSARSTLSERDQVQQWYAGVQTHFAAIQTATENIKFAAQNNKPSALPDLCGDLRTAVGAAKQDPVSPDQPMAKLVSSALQAYSDAAQSCLAGDYDATATAINTGGAFLTQANLIMTKLG